MSSEEERFPESDSGTPEPDSVGLDARPGMSLPKTIYVWLTIMIIAFVAPAVIPQQERRVSSGRESALTATEFSDIVSAETLVRAAFGLDATQRKLKNLGGSSGIGAMLGTTGLAKQQKKSLKDAEESFRKLEKSLHTPGLVRQIFIVEHALGEKLDQNLLTHQLPDNLKQDKKAADQIKTEQRLWSSLYGDSPSVASGDVAPFDTLIHGMNLHFLEDRVLSDLYYTAGDKKQATAYQSSFDQKMARSLVSQSMLGLSIVVAFLAGIVFLIVFLVAARTGNWPLIKQSPKQQPIAGWGDLLDAFAFYIASIKGVGLIVGLFATKVVTSPTPQTALILQASVYVATGLIALAYLHMWTLGRRGATLASIGLRAPGGILSEIGYGIAGYCAALPLLAVLGQVSHLIFQHDQTRTPNPILPLIAVSNDPSSRIVIYLLVACAAPFFEELFFRGVLFSGLRTRFGWVASAALSGMVFAMVHPMQDWLPIFGLGFALATMREMRQSLVPGMTAHFLQNSLSFITLSLLFRS